MSSALTDGWVSALPRFRCIANIIMLVYLDTLSILRDVRRSNFGWLDLGC